MLTSKNKGAGGKLNRSEIIQARLNPKAKFAVELMARLERRTVSSVFEGLLEQAIKNYPVEAMLQDKAQADLLLFGERKPQSTTLKEVLEHIWSHDDADRFVAFAMSFPDLLTPEEEKLWELIVQTPYFWAHYEINIEDQNGNVTDKGWWPVTSYQGLVREHVREYWPLLNSIVQGKASVKALKNDEQSGSIGKAVEKPTYMPTVKKRLSGHDNKI